MELKWKLSVDSKKLQHLQTSLAHGTTLRAQCMRLSQIGPEVAHSKGAPRHQDASSLRLLSDCCSSLTAFTAVWGPFSMIGSAVEDPIKALMLRPSAVFGIAPSALTSCHVALVVLSTSSSSWLRAWHP